MMGTEVILGWDKMTEEEKSSLNSIDDVKPYADRGAALPDVGYAELREGMKGTAIGEEEFFLTAEHTKRSNGTSSSSVSLRVDWI